MPVFSVIDKNARIRGSSVQPVITGMGSFTQMMLNALKQNGIEEVLPDEWYPFDSFMKALKEIFEKTGPATMKKIGRNVIDTARFPSSWDNIDIVLKKWDEAYKRTHKGNGIGGFTVHKTAENSYEVICDNPYPDHFDLGALDAVTRRFCPKGSRPHVRIENPDLGRDKGGETTRYIITW